MPKPNRTVFPSWAIKTPALKKLARILSLDLFHDCTAQTLLRDADEPIGIVFLRPLTLIRDGRAIIGTFVLHDPSGDLRNDVYIMGPWYTSLNGFVLDVAPKFLSFVLQHPDVKYLEADHREGIKALLSKRERNEAWLKQPHGSSSEASDWRQCSSAGRNPPSALHPALLRGHRLDWSQLPSTPTRKSAPERIV